MIANYITYGLAVLGALATFSIVVYILSQVQMRAWLRVIEKFLTNKYKQNEQKKK